MSAAFFSGLVISAVVLLPIVVIPFESLNCSLRLVLGLLLCIHLALFFSRLGVHQKWSFYERLHLLSNPSVAKSPFCNSSKAFDRFII